ncbi:MAG: phosphonate C-P lyase system protein PhnH, partial [Pseudomonadota bacterium]|nr:phosphonate C-P lyase system protein PhnH [Pseudomonadota bacterium]
MTATGLEGGFADPAIESARTFRLVLNAMARPGRIETVGTAEPPAPLCPAAG